MSQLASFSTRLWRWLTFPGPIPRGSKPPEDPPQTFTTGPDLIQRIVEAIALNQSVVLSGPRGCGKSYAVRAAIDEAMKRGILPEGAKVVLQGNREIPRDYLLEDEIAFRLETHGGVSQVIPYPRPAPLFAFAQRDSETGTVVCDDTGRVAMKNDWHRFVLFLDEINRFSDGVLDGLLSILEERKAVLAGLEYSLPVVVCMTMNPPGYDGSARRLSPPLAARIGRTYRLCSPDLDTLTDQILTSKVAALRDSYNREKATPDPAHPGQPRPEYPEVPARLLRKVGLTTLCLWGDISDPKTGNEYLTAGTRALLTEIMEHDRAMRKAMRELNGLCQFGPDGRAGADWLTAAIGLALGDAGRNRLGRAVLTAEHLKRTAVVSLAHKIYDSFSPASRPDLTERKEHLVDLIASQVLTRPWFDRLVDREVDDEPALKSLFEGDLLKTDDLSTSFRMAGVVDKVEVPRWHQAARQFRQRQERAGGDPAEALLTALVNVGLVEPGEEASGGDAPALLAGFNDARHDNLARELARRGGKLGGALSSLLNGPAARIGAVRVPLETELRGSYLIRCLGAGRFLEICKESQLNRRRDQLCLSRMLETLWAFPYDRDPPGHAVERLLKEITGSRTLLLSALARFLPHEFLRAVSATREPEVVPYLLFLKGVKRELERRNL
jgi:MoxR-like ATPase